MRHLHPLRAVRNNESPDGCTGAAISTIGHLSHPRHSHHRHQNILPIHQPRQDKFGLEIIQQIRIDHQKRPFVLSVGRSQRRNQGNRPKDRV